MLLIESLCAMMLASVPVKITAEHWGGFSNTVQWRLQLDEHQAVTFASDERYRRTTQVDGPALNRFLLFANETGFWDLKSSYGRGHMEFNSCRLTIVRGGRSKTVVLLAYPKDQPPVGVEATEVGKAFAIWDGVKDLGGLGALADDCRAPLNLR